MRERPSVLFVNHTLDPMAGGAEKVLYSLLEGLGSSGLDLELAAPRETDRTRLLAPDVDCHWLPPFRMVPSRSIPNLLRTAASLLRSSLAFGALLGRLRPDLIYVNSIFALHFVAIPAVIRGIPFVYHEHNLASQRSRSIWNLAFSRLVRRARLIVAISEAVAEELRRLGVPGSRIRVVHNAVERIGPTPTPARRPAAAGPFRVVQVANLHRWKGHATIVEAVALASRDGLDVSAAFFGRVQDEAFAAELRAQAADLDVTDRIDFSGFVSNAAERLTEFDSLVLASDAEPFGLAILEGMDAGIPVVATASGGALEIIEDGKTGMLFEPGNPRALADCWRRLATDPAFYDELIDGATASLDERFSPEAQIAGVRNAIAEALS